jgi:hypothetical protein
VIQDEYSNMTKAKFKVASRSKVLPVVDNVSIIKDDVASHCLR